MRKLTIPALAALFVAAMTATLFGDTGSFVDSRDGKVYRWVKIGTQTWMGENLNYDTANGAGSWCYNNDESNCKKYGRLYDWNTAINACLTGWRLPDTADWNALARTVGGQARPAYNKEGKEEGYYWSVAGGKLKSKIGWNDWRKYVNKYKSTIHSGNGTDDFGFSALPSGHCNKDGRGSGIGENGFWWSATEVGKHNVWSQIMKERDDAMVPVSWLKYSGYSIRCVRHD